MARRRRDTPNLDSEADEASGCAGRPPPVGPRAFRSWRPGVPGVLAQVNHRLFGEVPIEEAADSTGARSLWLVHGSSGFAKRVTGSNSLCQLVNPTIRTTTAADQPQPGSSGRSCPTPPRPPRSTCLGRGQRPVFVKRPVPLRARPCLDGRGHDHRAARRAGRQEDDYPRPPGGSPIGHRPAPLGINYPRLQGCSFIGCNRYLGSVSSS